MPNDLPVAILGDKNSLSPNAREAIQKLNGAAPWAFTLELIWAWAVVIGFITLALHLNTWWMSLLTVLVVATRQNVLGLLVHDQAHLLGYRGRFGDLGVNLLAAYPLLVLTVEGYAQVHLAHHRDYFGPSDPDFKRKSGPDWTFPMPPGRLARLFLRDLLGINTIALMRGKKPAEANPVFARRNAVPKWLRPLFFLVLIGLLSWAGLWTAFLLYWLLPLLTVTQVIIRWGAICEHEYGAPKATVAESTPLIVLSWWERLLLPNLNFAMHPYHHYFPGVPFSRLPALHRIYEHDGLIEEKHVFRGYGSYLRFITRKPA
ncbi:fatty acid desaturase family protein [Paucibacter sp. DJ2R-2]|uniref:fatty acid desaturase family protein n=1 Tax=Paucibacter sp. DJ2R-2 TaxID=2893558 RepID=UPI0021E45FD2|nr:fatty acid desaturase [Paucibacter sp. DJ2R-2]MCV2419350.1 fatty acid desaturase [Paucibacter sp. DJ4R-1]MCV2437746.1 fatty acid desaturase [Paucibacter sp. DJ2R-2]